MSKKSSLREEFEDFKTSLMGAVREIEERINQLQQQLNEIRSFIEAVETSEKLAGEDSKSPLLYWRKEMETGETSGFGVSPRLIYRALRSLRSVESIAYFGSRTGMRTTLENMGASATEISAILFAVTIAYEMIKYAQADVQRRIEETLKLWEERYAQSADYERRLAALHGKDIREESRQVST